MEPLIAVPYEAAHDRVLELVAEEPQPLAFLLHFLQANFTGFAQADDSRNVERAGAHAAFVSSAVNHRREFHARVLSPHVERADAFGAVDFVRRNGEQVDAVFLHVHGDFADGLNGVHMKEDFLFLGDFADFRDGLDDADFVVRVHDGDENRLGSDRAAEIVEVNQAVGRDGQIGDVAAGFFQALADVEHGLVLGRLGDDVIAVLAALFTKRVCDALDREVVRFGRAAGEDDLPGIGADQPGDLSAGIFDRFLGLPAEFVIAACRVAEFLGEIGQHGLEHARINRRRGLIVHVDREFDRHRDSILVRLGRGVQQVGKPAVAPFDSADWIEHPLNMDDNDKTETETETEKTEGLTTELTEEAQSARRKTKPEQRRQKAITAETQRTQRSAEHKD